MVKTQRKRAVKSDIDVKASALHYAKHVAQATEFDSNKTPGVNNSLLRSVVMAENVINRLQTLIDGIDGAYPSVNELNSSMSPRGEREEMKTTANRIEDYLERMLGHISMIELSLGL